MLIENGTSVLAFDGTHFLPCSETLPSASRITGWGPLDLAQRVVRLLTPTSLHAAAVFTNTTAGKAGSFSNFRSDPIDAAASVYIVPPPATVQVNVVVTNNGQPITVQVTADDKPAVNQLVKLLVAPSISNQSPKVEVAGETAITTSTGTATYPNFVIKKAGTYTIQAVFELGRPGVGVTFAQVAGIQAGGTGKKK
jgi:hypothetical protein